MCDNRNDEEKWRHSTLHHPFLPALRIIVQKPAHITGFLRRNLVMTIAGSFLDRLEWNSQSACNSWKTRFSPNFIRIGSKLRVSQRFKGKEVKWTPSAQFLTKSDEIRSATGFERVAQSLKMSSKSGKKGARCSHFKIYDERNSLGSILARSKKNMSTSLRSILDND